MINQTITSPPQARIAWWHQIELPDGSVTPGLDRSAEKLEALHLPDLTGKTVWTSAHLMDISLSQRSDWARRAWSQ